MSDDKWVTDGKWDNIHPDDPACNAMADQVVAGALDRIRNARSFVTFTIPADADTVMCDIAAVMEPDILPDGSEGTDREAIMRCQCDMLVRMWFENLSVSDGPIALVMMVQQFKENVAATIFRVLEEKGMVRDDG